MQQSSNKAKSRNKRKRKVAKQTTANDEILELQDKIELVYQQIEFWHELVESFKLELHEKEQQLHDTEQELKYTNQELCSTLLLEQVSLDQAKELSKTILKSNKSASEALAELLSAIYGSQVQSEELEQIDNSSIAPQPLKSAAHNRNINISAVPPKISNIRLSKQ